MEQTSDNNDLQSDSPNISWPLRRRGGSGSRAIEPDHDNSPKGHTNGNLNPSLYNRDNLPGQEKALDGISLRAFLLGISLGVGTVTTGLLAYHQEHIWRAPFFLAALSLFHFLEYYVTATYNTRYANISAFLLSQNGQAYNIAHTAAFTECILTSIFLPTWQTSLSRPSVVAFGCMMIVVGQVTRSIAMAQAGTNFNHTVQTRKNQGHELVTSGIYGYLRHPSYFGFFWWGIGTQVVLGNAICFLAYTFILWSFFRKRITKEEQLLTGFFGKAYEEYRAKTRIGIPFIG